MLARSTPSMAKPPSPSMPAPSAPPSPVQPLTSTPPTTANGSSITGLGNEAATLSDTTLAVSVLNTLDGNTSGTVNANTVTTLTGAADALNTAYDSSGISNLGNEAVTLSDTSLAPPFSTPSTATPHPSLTPTPSPPSPALPRGKPSMTVLTDENRHHGVICQRQSGRHSLRHHSRGGLHRPQHPRRQHIRHH